MRAPENLSIKSHILFRPYLYVVSASGIALAVWQLATVPMEISIHLMLFIIFGIVAECHDYIYEDRYTCLTLGAANSFFMMVFFPFSAVVVTFTLGLLSVAYLRKRKDKIKRIINEKTVYNIAAFTIFNYATYIAIKWSGIDLQNGVLVLGILVLFQNALNGIMLCTVQSLAINKSMFGAFLKDQFTYYLYTLLLSLMLVYNYYYIGIWAVIGIYLIFMTVQSSMQLSIDNKIKEEKIFLDSHTGVYNREYFIKTIEAKLREKKKFSIILLDMDEFKKINDKYGHLVGDQALQEFVKKIKGMLRREDFLYRYGGDEFAVIVSDSTAAVAVEKKLYAGKIVIHHREEVIDIKFSTGIYNCTGKEYSYEDIFQKVDAALYEAKQKGGNQIVYVASEELGLS